MLRLVLLLAVVALAGCGTRTIITDANTYSVTGVTTSLRSGERVALVNGYAAESVVEIYEQGGNQFLVDLRQVTDTAIAMAAKQLGTMDVVVDPSAQKKVTLKVMNAQMRFQYAPFNSRLRTSLELSAGFAGGSGAVARAENSAVILGGNDPHKRSVEGATMFAVTNLMNDQNFVSYLAK
jgi:hypothetical protein